MGPREAEAAPRNTSGWLGSRRLDRPWSSHAVHMVFPHQRHGQDWTAWHRTCGPSLPVHERPDFQDGSVESIELEVQAEKSQAINRSCRTHAAGYHTPPEWNPSQGHRVLRTWVWCHRHSSLRGEQHGEPQEPQDHTSDRQEHARMGSFPFYRAPDVKSRRSRRTCHHPERGLHVEDVQLVWEHAGDWGVGDV